MSVLLDVLIVFHLVYVVYWRQNNIGTSVTQEPFDGMKNCSEPLLPAIRPVQLHAASSAHLCPVFRCYSCCCELMSGGERRNTKNSSRFLFHLIRKGAL